MFWRHVFEHRFYIDLGMDSEMKCLFAHSQSFMNSIKFPMDLLDFISHFRKTRFVHDFISFFDTVFDIDLGWAWALILIRFGEPFKVKLHVFCICVCDVFVIVVDLRERWLRKVGRRSNIFVTCSILFRRGVLGGPLAHFGTLSAPCWWLSVPYF